MKTVRFLSLTLLLALWVPVLLLAAAPGREVRKVASFTRLRLSNSVRVVLRQGSPQKVEVEASAADLARLETTVDAGQLRIETKREDGKMWSTGRFEGRVTVYVTMPTVAELSIGGSGQLAAEDAVRAQALVLSVSGSGSMTLPRLTAEKLTSSISGSGSISMAGTCPQHEARISGSGDLKAADLRTEASVVRISGSGNARIYASRTLESRVSGSGDVYVRGGAKVSSTVSGSGRVHTE